MSHYLVAIVVLVLLVVVVTSKKTIKRNGKPLRYEYFTFLQTAPLLIKLLGTRHTHSH